MSLLQPFDKLLVANRGEIACRVLRGAKALGYETVAVYSEADADALHVQLADEAVCVGGAAARESYLSSEKLLAAAAQTGAQAVHPGYGFLAESAAFAEACACAGLVFVGPPPQAMEAMGDKAKAKERMLAANVPCVPGYQGDTQDHATLATEAERVGFPLLVKAAAGGGGRGMRRVDEAAGLEAALASARQEAESAFGDGTLLLEKLLTEARHVEVQVFADGQGNVVHLGERDCSTQRRHQKVIEEAPSPAVDEALRQRMGAAAVAAAKAVHYVGAGTVEFLLTASGDFYFLEMNTRLQVEHPVTELVCGLDLVALQLEVAAGRPLPFAQDDVRLQGWAIEARLYAEDPASGYLPQTGPILAFEAGQGEGVRVDHGVRAGQEVTAHYDPLLAKVIAYGADRDQARRRLRRALDETRLLGLGHNKRFLRALLVDPIFAAGEMTTATLDGWGAERPALAPTPPLSDEGWAVAAALWHALEAQVASRSGSWGFRSAHGEVGQRLELVAEGGESRSLVMTLEGEALVCAQPDGSRWRLRVLESGESVARVLVASTVEGRLEVQRDVAWAFQEGALHLELADAQYTFREVVARGREEQQAAGSGVVAAPTSGRVVNVAVELGQRVEAGQLAVTLEAMKMETPVRCDVDGEVVELRARVGEQVERGALVLRVEPASAETLASEQALAQAGEQPGEGGDDG
jgi:geranyl-CoA carboxylase alpha subunit